MSTPRTRQSEPTSGTLLIEVLVVLAIVGVVAGILFPALTQAKRTSYEAADIDKMRQVANAGALYCAEHGDYPLRIEQLVSAKALDRQVCKLATDPYPEGFEGYYLQHLQSIPVLSKSVASYPQSMLTLGDFNYGETDMRRFLKNANPGWAIAATQGVPGSHDSSVWGARYHRIQVDGSVTTHRIPIERETDAYGRRSETLHYRNLFSDPRS